MIGLFQAFEDLVSPKGTDVLELYSARAIPNSPYRVAKDREGFPALLVELPAKQKDGLVAVQLRHISIRHNVTCRIVAKNSGETKSSCSIIRCNASDRALWEIFFRICEVLIRQVGAKPKIEHLRRILDQMAALFSALGAPGTGTVQGLWSELFLIANAKNPRAVFSSWHSTLGDRYDFALGNDRLEMKSSASRHRRHHFSLEQLLPPADARLVIASVFAESSGGGISVMDLIDKIKSRAALGADEEARLWALVAATLGQDWERSLSATFDPLLARQSLAFYWGSDVPRIAEPVPLEVSAIEFISDIDGLVPIPKANLRAASGLLGALI